MSMSKSLTERIPFQASCKFRILNILHGFLYLGLCNHTALLLMLVLTMIFSNRDWIQSMARKANVMLFNSERKEVRCTHFPSALVNKKDPITIWYLHADNIYTTRKYFEKIADIFKTNVVFNGSPKKPCDIYILKPIFKYDR